MDQTVAEMLAAARRERVPGADPRALAAYREAAREALRLWDIEGLAHALRHVADLELETGNGCESLDRASEAVALYQANGDAQKLDLANALRLKALAQEALCIDPAATWREARALYEQCDIAAGIAECETHLPA